MTVSELRAFNRFKGSVFFGSGIILVVYAVVTPLGLVCAACPPLVRKSSLAEVLIPTTFLLFLGTVGLFLLVLGFYTFKEGGLPWRRFSSENIAFAFAVSFVCLLAVDIVLYCIQIGRSASFFLPVHE